MKNRSGINLLRFGPIRRLLLWPAYPYVIQIVFLAAFVSLAWLGWGLFTPDGVKDKLYAKTNLVNLTIWGIWWPLMIWLAVAFGRIWCGLCPLELVANVAERLGGASGLGKRTLGPWLRSGMVILFLYASIQMLVPGIHLHRVPAFTSLFLIGLLALATLTGFFYKDRAFCRGFCPVGLLLAAYGRGSMLVVRPISPESCDGCAHHSCTSDALRDRLDGRSCPSLLNPARLNKSNDCLICAQCIKTYRPERNMALYLRRPYHSADSRESLATWTLTLFTMLLSGFVAYELCTEWTAAKELFLAPSKAIAGWMGLDESNGWIKGVWMLFVFPMLLWLSLGAMVLAARGARSIADAWRRLAWPLIPLIAIGLVVLFAAFGPRENSLAGDGAHRSRILPVAALALIEVFLVWGWGFGS